MNVALLLSGGVDSSVALRLLLDQGHDVTAFYLKIWLEDELSFLGECPWEEDLAFARQVCAQAGVDLEVVPLQREYHDRVVTWAVEELRQGRTPSPDILCNQHIKFGAFVDAVGDRFGDRFERVASGHYARLRTLEDGTTQLLRGVDPLKDQTYFLYQLSQEQLRRCMFPLGALTKAEVRSLASAYDLPNRDRKDSQGICFLGKIQYDQFVAAHLGEKPGAIRHIESGRVMGRHHGHWFYTIGQRKGLGLGAGPWYVVDKDGLDNVVWISHKNELPEFRRDRFTLPAPHWIGRPPAPGTHAVEVRIRHSPSAPPATLTVGPERAVDIELQDGDPGVAPGQSAVIYQDDLCLGGGQIQTNRSFNTPSPS